MAAECIDCDRYPCRCDDRLADDDEPEDVDDEFNPHECPDCGGELDQDGCPECGWYDDEEDEL